MIFSNIIFKFDSSERNNGIKQRLLLPVVLINLSRYRVYLRHSYTSKDALYTRLYVDTVVGEVPAKPVKSIYDV